MNILLVNSFLVLLFGSFLIWVLKRSICKNASNRKLPPSPPKIPILGNFHQMSPLTHRSFKSLGEKYGPVMLLYFGSKPVIIVQSADAASEIMKTHDLVFATKPGSQTMRLLFYNMRNISVAPYGEYWRKVKSICILHILSNKRVQSFRSIREDETALLMARIELCLSLRSPVNLSELFVSLTNDIICRSAFGRKYSEGDDGKKFVMLLKETMHLLGTLSIGEFIPCLSWINRFNGFDYRVARVAREVDEFLEAVLEEHLDEGRKDVNREDFVDILLAIYREDTDGFSIDRDSIKAVILDLLVGGTDTSFAMLEWAMTELLRNPMIMKKLQTEVKEILQGKKDIKDEDLEKMLYLKAVIKETFRSHIPVPFMAREPQEDIEIMGYNIAKGATVLINSWAIARDPASWDEPEKFKPERFLNNSIDFKGLDFGLIPFGAGRRRCPGIAFAMANVELVLATIVHKFDWELPKGEELDCLEHPGVTIHRKNPLFAIPTQCYSIPNASIDFDSVS